MNVRFRSELCHNAGEGNILDVRRPLQLAVT